MAEVIDNPKPEDAADILYEYADNFVTHWMDDDGLDAEERKEVDAASAQMNGAHDTVKAALKAAAEMKTALRKSQQNIEQLASTVNTLSNKLGLGRKVRAEDFDEPARVAIAAAEAAGI